VPPITLKLFAVKEPFTVNLLLSNSPKISGFAVFEFAITNLLFAFANTLLFPALLPIKILFSPESRLAHELNPIAVL
jgi:hypothetical protein